MSYKAGAPGHFWPKVGGFLAIPMAGAAVSFLTTMPILAANVKAAASKQPVSIGSLEAAGALSMLIHGAGAYACYHYCQDDRASVGMQAFLRGGMWGEGLAAVTQPVKIGIEAVVGGAANVASSTSSSSSSSSSSSATGTKVSGEDSPSGLDGIINILSGGSIRRAKEQTFPAGNRGYPAMTG